MSEFLITLISIVVGALILLAGALVGGWLIFRGRSQVGDSFLAPSSPKGEVFTIPESSGALNFPGEEEPTGAEKKILNRTVEFLNRFNSKEAS